MGYYFTTILLMLGLKINNLVIANFKFKVHLT